MFFISYAPPTQTSVIKNTGKVGFICYTIGKVGIICFTKDRYLYQNLSKNFFHFKFFFTTTRKNIIKSNSKKKQLHESIIKITVVKIHTQREKKTYVKKNLNKKKEKRKRKAAPSSLPKKKEDPYNIPDGGPYGDSQGIGAVNCCRKDLHPRGCRYPRFSSFLCKCNLTKC